jgi:hypothetical protein
MFVRGLVALGLVGAGAASGCVDVPGNAAVVARVDLPAEGTPPAAKSQVHFTVRREGALLVTAKHEWKAPYRYTIRGIPLRAEGFVDVEVRLLDPGGVELGSARKDGIRLKPGAQSDLVVLEIGWKSQADAASDKPTADGGDAGGDDGDAPDEGAKDADTPDLGVADAGPAETADAPPSDTSTESRPLLPPCRDNETRVCGGYDCGRETCIGGEWGLCRGTGQRVPCGLGFCGTKLCNYQTGTFGFCEGDGRQRQCGECGVETCGPTGSWTGCQSDGRSRVCPTGKGRQYCGPYGSWDLVCTP